MTAGHIRMLRSPAVINANLGSDALQNVVGMHRCPTFVRCARLPSTSLTYHRMHCRTPLVRTTYTLVCASRLPPLPLATFVRGALLPSTLPTSVRTHC